MRTTQGKWKTFLFWNYRLFPLAYIQFGSHQWIQDYLGKIFCWFSREVFELETNPILIFASFFQGLSLEHIRFLLQPTQQLKQHKTWFWAICLTSMKKFLLLKKFEIFLHQISSFRQLLGFIWRHYNISSKNGHQSMDSF